MLPVVFALAMVLVGFLGVWAWIGLSGDGDDVAALVPTPSATVTGATPTGTGATPSDSLSPSSTPTQATSPTPSPTKTRTSTKPATVPDRGAAVVVFNQTGVSGLAANFAARLGQAGWTVAGVDNWVGSVPATTVYYRPGDEAAARTLMKDFPEVGRVRPAISGMPDRGLTVILAGDATLRWVRQPGTDDGWQLGGGTGGLPPR
jgi:hypothetical protein